MNLWVLVGALLLDFGLADPWGWFHPVQAMGWLIRQVEQRVFGLKLDPVWQRWAGGGLTVLLVGGSFCYAWMLPRILAQVHPWLGTVAEIILLASCLGGRSLRFAALEVLDPLQRGDLATARTLLSRYVGRDTADLDATEICRALVETVAENTPDGGTAPLFYGALGGAPLAFAYKAVSTLDSMIGYRQAPYTYFGTVAARLEDGLTWLPCRLTVLTLALWNPDPWRFWQRCRQDAQADPSPNSGWSEAAFAWTLGVQLGGENRYRGVPRTKPKLGIRLHDLTPKQVLESVQWLRRVLGSWVVVILLIQVGLGYLATGTTQR